MNSTLQYSIYNRNNRLNKKINYSIKSQYKCLKFNPINCYSYSVPIKRKKTVHLKTVFLEM